MTTEQVAHAPHRPVRFGIHVHHEGPPRGAIEQVQLAEQLGFESAWVGDSQLLMPEPYTLLGACAVSTSRIGLGTGVSNAGTRHPAVIASGLAALADLAPGRISAVIGVGGSSHASIGRKPDSLAALRNSVDLIGRMLGGERVPHNGRELRLVWATSERTRQVRLYVHAGGPLGQRQAGELGYGVELPVSMRELPGALSRVADAAAATGRRVEDMNVCWWNSVCIADDWEIIKEHMSAATSTTLASKYRAFAQGKATEDALAVDVALAREVAEVFDHVEHARSTSRAAQLLMHQSDEVWLQLTRDSLIGPPELVAERIRQALQSGPVTDVVFSPRLSTERLSVENIMESLARKVLPLVTGAASPA